MSNLRIGCLGFIILVSLVGLLMLAQFSPAQPVGHHATDRRNEEEATRILRALLAHWVDEGAFPTFLRDLASDSVPEQVMTWDYYLWSNQPPSFELVRDIQSRHAEIGFHSEWRSSSDPAIQEEALELLKAVIRCYLADEAWPPDHAALGLPADWGRYGPWEYVAPRAADEYGERRRGSLRRKDTPSLVLEFDPPDLYVDKAYDS